MSPTPDAQPGPAEETSDRMRKKRVDKRYDPEQRSLTKVTLHVGDRERTYQVEFDHRSHGRLAFKRLVAEDDTIWEDVGADAPADVHEAVLVASRAAWDERLGVEMPVTEQSRAGDIDLYDDINPEGYVQSADAEDVAAEGDD